MEYDTNMFVTIISLAAAIIGFVVAIITIYDRRRLKDGIKNTYDAKLLDLRKTQIEQDKLELERKKLEARNKWKNTEFGLKLLDLLFSRDEEIIEEYVEEVED